MFEMNWVEYVRRDTEGSDSDTRRRAASELVKSLTERFPQQARGCGWVGRENAWAGECLSKNMPCWIASHVMPDPASLLTLPPAHSTNQPTNQPLVQVTELFSGYVGAMLQDHARSPAANWKSKDCAMYLVTALTVRGKTAAAGATTTNELVSLQDFFTQQVAPELQAAAVDEQSILKADALKFVTTFRSQLSKEATMALFPSLIK
jgi:hypothetical protein